MWKFVFAIGLLTVSCQPSRADEDLKFYDYFDSFLGKPFFRIVRKGGEYYDSLGDMAFRMLPCADSEKMVCPENMDGSPFFVCPLSVTREPSEAAEGRMWEYKGVPFTLKRVFEHLGGATHYLIETMKAVEFPARTDGGSSKPVSETRYIRTTYPYRLERGVVSFKVEQSLDKVKYEITAVHRAVGDGILQHDPAPWKGK